MKFQVFWLQKYLPLIYNLIFSGFSSDSAQGSFCGPLSYVDKGNSLRLVAAKETYILSPDPPRLSVSVPTEKHQLMVYSSAKL